MERRGSRAYVGFFLRKQGLLRSKDGSLVLSQPIAEQGHVGRLLRLIPASLCRLLRLSPSLGQLEELHGVCIAV